MISAANLSINWTILVHLVSILQTALNIVQTILLIAGGFMALKHKGLPMGAIDKIEVAK
jgi:hypothetical protein